MSCGIVSFPIAELEAMQRYPKELFYKGDVALLHKKKLSIVGSRHPTRYSKELTHTLASKLASCGVVVVSGGAIGIDTVAHKAATPKNTIMVAGTGLDKRYPAINKHLIAEIEQEGLVLSQFREGTPSQKYNFPLRNELVVALGEVLVVAHADSNSGTMRSVEYALKMGKEVFVFPQRLGESDATNQLLAQGKAEAIYDIDAFVTRFGGVEDTGVQKTVYDDPFLQLCATSPTYDEALQFDATKLFEYELQGIIEVRNGLVRIVE